MIRYHPAALRKPYLTPFASRPLEVFLPGNDGLTSHDVTLDQHLNGVVSTRCTRVRVGREHTVRIRLGSRELMLPRDAQVMRWDGRRVARARAGDVRRGEWLFLVANGGGQLPVMLDHLPVPADILAAARAEGLRMRSQIPLDRQFGHWVAIYQSDGWAQCRNEVLDSVGLANRHEEVRQAALAALAAVILEPGSELPSYSERERNSLTSGTTTELNIRSPALARLLDWLIGRGAGRKRLPGMALVAPIEFRVGIFGAAMSCDGGFGMTANFDPNITETWSASFSTTSVHCALHLYQVAASLGQIGWITESPGRREHQAAFSVGFRHSQIARWLVDTLVRDDRKNRLEMISEGELEPTKFRFPTHRGLLDLCRELPAVQAILNAIYKGAIGSVLLDRLLSVVPPLAFAGEPELLAWRDWVMWPDLTWHQVSDDVSPAGLAMAWPVSDRLHLLAEGFSAFGL